MKTQNILLNLNRLQNSALNQNLQEIN